MQNSFEPGGSGPGGPKPPMPFRLEDLDFSKLTGIVKFILLGLILVAIFMGLNWARTFYTDWLWFSNLGYQEVLFVRVTTQVWLYLLAALVFVGLAAPNFYAAYRSTEKYQWKPGKELSPGKYQVARSLMFWIGILAIVVGAVILAGHPAARWETFLRFFNGVSFNETDPIFGRDLSFFVFTLPVLEFIRTWLMGSLVVILLFTAGFYYVSKNLKGEVFSFEGSIRTHVLILGAFIFLMIAAGHWLGRYDLLFSRTGAVFGVGYTDNHVLLPARAILTVIAIISSALLLAATRTRGNRLIYGAVGVWLVLNFFAGGVLPGIVQRLQVEPSELARERSFIANNIEYTP
jgi:uncharacterized protein